MELETPLLYKVKYGETLRRFHALVLTCESGLGMDGLRAKICSLFNLPSNSDLKLTYVDEDGDVVTLVDDDDLYDIIRQKLKFVMIYVELSGEMNKHPHSGLRRTGDSPAQPICHDNTHPNFGGYSFRWKVTCGSCGDHFIPRLLSKSTGQENLDLCPTCCTKIGTQNDTVRTTNQSGGRQKLPSSQVVHNQNPGLGPLLEPPVTREDGSKPGELEQNGCLIRNDSILGTPRRLYNGEEDSFLLASLLDKVSKDCQRFSAAPAAGTSTESHPVAWDKRLPAVSVGAPPLLENGFDRKNMEIQLRQMKEKRLRRVDNSRDDYSLKYLVDSYDKNIYAATLDDLKKMGFRAAWGIESLLKEE